ncbi:heat-shock protein Hsp20 [Kordiimonas sediminis]|uniref:Heat-shock protein Hsp20 n=1 Tax=Kordiimonas sediminis TaxID=1735581 RepID=A0A919E554_9PROT|nr:Hsp20 family protein [Kordiimonas sediminis]GHF20223.1 heat-shock protein Hsp20 [Kordiimonas sediminis]
MRRYDLSPLLRSSVGFDHLNRLFDSVAGTETTNAYPPYNIEKVSEDDYRITMAVAGFSPDELDVTVTDGTLVISGRALDDDEDRSFIHKGIAKRAFERRFSLAETIQVGDARFENGLLDIELKRVIPDHMKPRSVEIKSAQTSKRKVIEADAA